MLADSGARVMLTSGPLPEGLRLPEDVALIDLATVRPVSGHELTDGPMPQDEAYVLIRQAPRAVPKACRYLTGR